MSLRRKVIQRKKLKSNKTRQFLVPLLGYPLSYYTDHFIEAYVVPDDDPRLVCIFENINNEDLEIHLIRLENHHCFVRKYKDDKNKELVYIFDIDGIFIKDFNRFLDGKYSELSGRMRAILEREYGKTTILDSHLATMFDTLYPTPRKIKQLADHLGVEESEIVEVLDKPNIDNEIYRNIEDFNNYYAN